MQCFAFAHDNDDDDNDDDTAAAMCRIIWGMCVSACMSTSLQAEVRETFQSQFSPTTGSRFQTWVIRLKQQARYSLSHLMRGGQR